MSYGVCPKQIYAELKVACCLIEADTEKIFWMAVENSVAL